MLVAIVPLLVAVLGALIFALSSNATVKEIGRAMLWVGLLWLVYTVAGKTVRFG